MNDVVLITGEAARYDYVDRMDHVASLDVIRGFSAGHYTRPSLSGLHSCSYVGAIQTKPQSPTLAEAFEAAGYTCIGMTTNPQAYGGFNFDAGYADYRNFADPGTKGSTIREFLARFTIVQRLYQRFYPFRKRRQERPSDAEVVDMAVEAWNDAEGPRFLWIHMMDSHRPYGLGGEAISPELSRKAKFSPEKVTESEQAEVREKYAAALERVDDNVARLREAVDGDPIFAFAGDHGELLGEHDVFFHPPHEKHVHDEITNVPMAFDGVDVTASQGSLIDLGPTLLGAVGLDAPAEWQGNDLRETETRTPLTIVPWQQSADVLWQDADSKIRMSGCSVTFETPEARGRQEELDTDGEVAERLRDFGYLE